jgi:hypothetical protein
MRGARGEAPIVYFPSNTKTGIALPIETRPFSGDRVRYVPWEKRYFIQENRATDRDPESRLPKAFFLSADGRAEIVPRPDLAVWATSVAFYPTRVGLVINGSRKDDRTASNALAYLLRGGAIHEIGPARTLEVSPDGCSAAFVSSEGATPNYRPHDGFAIYQPERDWEARRPGHQTIRIIRFCEKGER